MGNTFETLLRDFSDRRAAGLNRPDTVDRTNELIDRVSDLEWAVQRLLELLRDKEQT
jgi:hypothetical protein